MLRNSHQQFQRDLALNPMPDWRASYEEDPLWAIHTSTKSNFIKRTKLITAHMKLSPTQMPHIPPVNRWSDLLIFNREILTNYWQKAMQFWTKDILGYTYAAIFVLICWSRIALIMLDFQIAQYLPPCANQMNLFRISNFSCGGSQITPDTA